MELILKGIYTRNDDYYQFELPADDLRKLANAITLLGNKTEDFLSVTIEQGKLLMALSDRQAFLASIGQDGSIQIEASPSYYAKLVERLSDMADDNDPEHYGLVHTHLDLYMSAPSPDISDIVIERLDEVEANETSQ